MGIIPNTLGNLIKSEEVEERKEIRRKKRIRKLEKKPSPL